MNGSFSTPGHGIPRPLRRYATFVVVGVVAWFGITYVGFGIVRHVVPLAVKGIKEARKAFPSAQPSSQPTSYMGPIAHAPPKMNPWPIEPASPEVSWPQMAMATATVSAFEVDPPTCTCNAIVKITAQGQVESKDVTYAIEHEIPKAGGTLCFKTEAK